jgi:predicted unusual protein kinase regulating ubiquinone biosynthesis (AarF/ABC1/UbiB family)
MAGELKVAHGAVGLWESGARTIPGPVLKLMELFEAELELTDGQPVVKPITRLRTSALARSFKLTRTAASATARAAMVAFEKLFASQERTNAVVAAAQVGFARQIVEALGELKGFAMKVGQMASYVDFALPEEAREVLASLQTSTRPMAPGLVAQVVLEELGATPLTLFAEWSPRPFAAASIGQVHRARLKTGEPVAVKVQYPGIAQAIRADLKNTALLDRAARLIFRAQQPGVILDELRERFLEECDYRVEASNQEEFRRLWAGRRGVTVPRVYTDLTSERVLVTELCQGERLPAFLARATQAARNRAGALIWDFAFESVFRHRIFNGDPHPGNFLFTAGGVIFLDFGCVKRFDLPHVERWGGFVRATLERDAVRANRLWMEMGMTPDPSRYDFDYHQRMIHTLYEPWLLDQPFRFDVEYVERLWHVVTFGNRNRASLNVPRDWVLANRLEAGLYHLLAKLGCTTNWRRKILALLYPRGATHPAPFLEQEVAALRAPA